MNRMSDQKYLLTEQYKNPSNLTDRATLHIRFNTNPYGWMLWVFDQFDFSEEARILELGCGPAWLWRENLDRIPEGWKITLSDFSPGMLAEAQTHLQDCGRAFHLEQVDAQSIPFGDGTFDGVIANHMFYHVPDRQKAFSEVRRVLKYGGRLFAATNGDAHMKDLRELAGRVDSEAYGGFGSDEFGLENGEGQLAPWFEAIEIRFQDNGLHVTEVDPLIAYVASSKRLDEAQLSELRTLVEAEIAEKGAFDIEKKQGMFVARRAV